MRSILGFLNQSQWVEDLNIGEIMQITLISQQSLLSNPRDESELMRESLLAKIAMIVVSYFCVSTELRFINLRAPNKVAAAKKA